MMNKFCRKLMMIVLLILVITGCTTTTQTAAPVPSVTIEPTESPTPSPTATSSPTPTPAYTALPASEGPTLLLQTDFDRYQIIDFGLGITYDFFPPNEGIEYNMASNISPDRNQMLFINDTEGIRVTDLATGIVRANFSFSIDGFQPELAVDAIQATLPDVAYTDDMLVNAVNSAYLESLQYVTWFQDSDHLLMVEPGSETSTNLALIDLNTGESTSLESKPGFVQGVKISPNKDYILVKKSYIFEANVWEDDQYHLIDLSENTVISLSLPHNVDNPSLNWFDQDHLQLVHKTDIAGSEGFSILNIHTMDSTYVIPGIFTKVWKLDDGVAAFTIGTQEEEPLLELFSLQGERIAYQTLPAGCDRTFTVGEQILVNCTDESLLLDEDLSQETFGEPIARLKSTPLGIIIITRSSEFFLYDSSLTNYQSLELVGEPIEILWLPDSSGFLYRTTGSVYLYDFLSRSSTLLLESDLFSDYRNLNAVWININ